MSIFIHKNDQQEGPYDLDTIQSGLADGRFAVEDFAFQEGCADWVPLHTLLPALAEPPPVPVLVPQVVPAPTTPKATKIFVTTARGQNSVAHLIGEDQDSGVVEKIINRAKELLTKFEEIEYIGVQKKPILTIAPDAVLLTNKRFMIVRPKLMGMTFEDHLWKEVLDVHMSEQMLTATITCKIVSGRSMYVDYIPKKQARRIYSYTQEIEERMHHERRKLDMEEKRAAAGGVIIQSPVGYSAPPPLPTPQALPQSVDDPVELLGKLKRMLDAGLIEVAEYEAKKSEILSRM